MDTDKIRAGLPRVRQALIRACDNKSRISIPVQPTDDDQVLWQAAEDLEAAAAELDTLRAENARLRKMLYDMTSLSDWYQAGYDTAEYDALNREFDGKSK